MAIGMLSCSDDDQNNRIPWAPVNFRVDIGGYDKELNTAGTSKAFTIPADFRPGGYNKLGFAGLVVVTNIFPDNSGRITLSAFDACCPYEAQQNIKISILAEGKAKCETCNSVYDLYSGGNVSQGPSRWRLKWYHVREQYPGSGIFFIEN